MGGKSKQSQRTKNNVRPSSSGRSAELLSNAVKVDSSLVVFGGGKVVPTLFPTMGAFNIDQELSTEFTLCIKKFNKKDPITKTKALQELCELIMKCEIEETIAALPIWSHYYKILSMDIDHKVREAAQLCHGAIASACGRRLAPHLKSLVPVWVQAQYDDYAPAAAAAITSFTSTFPQNKLPEVVSFCKSETMAYLISNLIGDSQSLLTNKNENAEEKELQKSRIVVGSLNGLEYLCEHLSSEHTDWLWSEMQVLLQNNAFWKYVQHTSTTVRSSWYGVMGRVVARFGTRLGGAYGQKATRTLLAATTRDRTGVPAYRLWTCFTMLMHHVEDWYKWLDKKETFTRRILEILEIGGWGDARHLSNILLPLLAYSPKEMLTKNFYESFFLAMFSGLIKRSVISSKSERQSWITSIAECLRYLSIQEYEFAVEVTTSVHRKWLENVLSPIHTGQLRDGLIKYSVTNMTSLIKYWLKQSSETNNDKYEQLVRNFWQNITSSILNEIENLTTDGESINKTAEGHILLINTLKTAFLYETKKQHSITFEDDSRSMRDAERTTAARVPTPPADSSIIERFNHNLNELVEKVCSTYIVISNEHLLTNEVLSPLMTLLREFNSEHLYVFISEQFGKHSVFALYQDVFREWLCTDSKRCKPLMAITFTMLTYMTEEEQNAVFDSFKQFTPSVVEWCIELSLSHPHSTFKSVRRWIQSKLVEETLLSLCAKMIREGDSVARNSLMMSLSHLPDGELMIPDSTVSSIVRVIGEALEDLESDHLEYIASGAALLTNALTVRCHADDYTSTLMCRLFNLSVSLQCSDSRLSPDTWGEVHSAWRDGFTSLSNEQRMTFVNNAVSLIHQHIYTKNEDLQIAYIEHLADMCSSLGLNFSDLQPSENLNELISFTRQLYDFKKTFKTTMEAYALRRDCVAGKLNCPFEDDSEVIKIVVKESEKEPSELTREVAVSHANSTLFRTAFLKIIFLNKPDCEEETQGESWCNTLMRNQYFQELFCDVLHDYIIICSLHETYAFWPHYNIIQKLKNRLDMLVREMINALCEEARQKIKTYVGERAASVGYYWAYVNKFYKSAVRAESSSDKSRNSEQIGEESFHVLNFESVITGNGFFHTLQAECGSGSDDEMVLRCKYAVMVRSMYLAHAHEPAIANEEYVRAAVEGFSACNMDVVINTYYQHNHTMLYDRHLITADWKQIVSNAAIVDYLIELVTRRGWDLPSHHWDFTSIALSSLLSSLQLSIQKWSCTKVCVVLRPVMQLYCVVKRFNDGVAEESERRQPSDHVADLPTEWMNIFAPDITRDLFSIIMHVLGACEKTATANQASALSSLLTVVPQIKWNQLPKNHQVDEFKIERVMQRCGDALKVPAHCGYMYLAFYTLKMMAKPIILEDAEKLLAWSNDSSVEAEVERTLPEFLLTRYEDTLLPLQEFVDTALSHIIVGEQTCELLPYTDSYELTLGYLLLSHCLLSTAKLARSDLFVHYIELIRSHSYCDILLSTILRVVPQEVVASAESSAYPPPSAALSELFTSTPRLTLDNDVAYCGYEVVQAVACSVLLVIAESPAGPALRRYWSTASTAAARMLRALVDVHVAPAIIHSQLHAVHTQRSRLAPAEITIHWSSREVICTLAVEERNVSIKISLARSHPLLPPQVSHAVSPAPNTQWLAFYLAHQNGSVLHALRMWRSAVTKRVESAPQCYICYCRLQPTTGHLPRVPCHQCNNKFHTDCLRKWFTTSNKSNCPLCRATF